MSPLETKKKEIDHAFSKFMSEAKSVNKKARLNRFNAICERLVSQGVQLKISLVVQYMVENGLEMSNQSIYNKQGGVNPYRSIFDLWSEYDSLRRSSKGVSVKSQSVDIIGEEDLKLILDPALRYRVSLMFSEVRGLKKQNDLLRQVKEMNHIQSVPEHMIDKKSPESIVLNRYEIDTIRELVEKNTYISFDEDGAMKAKSPIRKEQVLSSQGLLVALKKILESYTGS